MKKLIRVFIAVFCLFFALMAISGSNLPAITPYTQKIPEYMSRATLRLYLGGPADCRSIELYMKAARPVRHRNRCLSENDHGIRLQECRTLADLPKGLQKALVGIRLFTAGSADRTDDFVSRMQVKSCHCHLHHICHLLLLYPYICRGSRLSEKARHVRINEVIGFCLIDVLHP